MNVYEIRIQVFNFKILNNSLLCASILKRWCMIVVFSCSEKHTKRPFIKHIGSGQLCLGNINAGTINL